MAAHWYFVIGGKPISRHLVKAMVAGLVNVCPKPTPPPPQINDRKLFNKITRHAIYYMPTYTIEGVLLLQREFVICCSGLRHAFNARF
jgi:hypothetical protein